MNRQVLEGILANDHKVVSRVISRVEAGDNLGDDFYIQLHAHSTAARRIGITGPPGVGKSTLADGLIQCYLDQGQSVGVVAVDPTSPFTGGALLGDRVRMNRYGWNQNVFIRSLGSQGKLGGLSRKVQEVGDILASSGKEVIIFETVGVGQGEHDVAQVADLTVVVLVPESGDEVQLMKAGLIEIADLFVVNKSDREGADRLQQLLSDMLGAFPPSQSHRPPVFATVAHQNTGIADLHQGISDLFDTYEREAVLARKRLDRHRQRVFSLIQERLLEQFWTPERLHFLERATSSLDSVAISPHETAKHLLNQRRES